MNAKMMAEHALLGLQKKNYNFFLHFLSLLAHLKLLIIHQSEGSWLPFLKGKHQSINQSTCFI
jgi:hypothetical protein